MYHKHPETRIWYNIYLVFKKFLILACLTVCISLAPGAPALAGLFDYDRVPGLVAGMSYVEGGCFVMGDRFGDGYPDEKPTHEVCVDNYYIGKYEVTLAAFRAFVADSAYVTDAEKGAGCYTLVDTQWKPRKDLNWRDPGFPQSDSSPVVCVSHNDALAYAKWKSRKYRKAYRLPTEAEWEFASRDRGRNYRFTWGNREEPPHGNIYDSSAHKNIGPIAALGNYHDGYVHTSPVARYAPNILGIHDLSGNAWEWVNDIYSARYYAASARTNPKGPSSGSLRVIRGGSWYSKLSCLRTSKRSKLPPSHSYTIAGFRLAMTPR